MYFYNLNNLFYTIFLAILSFKLAKAIKHNVVPKTLTQRIDIQ